VGSGRNSEKADVKRSEVERGARRLPLPQPSASYRRRAWIEFQRALDPLAPLKPLPPPRV
jgi:hypothetical protein